MSEERIPRPRSWVDYVILVALLLIMAGGIFMNLWRQL